MLYIVGRKITMVTYIFGLIGLLVASIQDIKSREIEDYIWISMVIFGLIYNIYLSMATGNYFFIINSIFGFIICFVLGYLMFLFGVGGGDGKVLIGMGTLTPNYDMPIYSTLGNILTIGYIPAFPIMVFINGMFFMIFLPIIILIQNLLKGNTPKNFKEIMVLSFGEKMKVSEAKKKNRLIMGRDNDKINLFPSSEDDDFSKYSDGEIIYVTPMIPLIIPITISYIITPFIGDNIIYLIISNIKI
jgi:preflagellin peptidase FlaK